MNQDGGGPAAAAGGGGKKRNRNRNKNKNKNSNKNSESSEPSTTNNVGPDVPPTRPNVPVQQEPEVKKEPSPPKANKNDNKKEKSPPTKGNNNKEQSPPKENNKKKSQTPEQQQKPPNNVTEEVTPSNGVTSDGINVEMQQQQELVENLRQDFFIPNVVELMEAERKYAMMMMDLQNGDINGEIKPGRKLSADSDDFDLFASSSEDSEPSKKRVLNKPNKLNSAKKNYQSNTHSKSALSAEIAKARQHIKNSLECVDGLAAIAGSPNSDLSNRVKNLENENKTLKKVTDDLKNLVIKLESRLNQIEKSGGGGSTAAAKPPVAKSAPAEEDDDEVDLFGSDSDEEEEDADKARIREERLKAYAEKKSKKPGPIAKTSVLFDVKPWDDETDMDAMLKCCKSIEKDGLLWGASKLVPVGYGIQKLQVMCVVEDEKVSIDELSEQITEFEDYVQSVDIAAMSKI